MKNARRKIKCTVVLLSLLLAFTACGTPPPESDTTSVSSSPVLPLPDSPIEEPAVEAKELQFHSVMQGAANEFGYYEVALRADGSGNIFFTDFASRLKTVLCSRPECTHDNETCGGYLPNAANIPEIAVTQNALVLVYPGNPYMTENPENMFAHIELRDLNGGNPRTICRFESNTQLDYRFALADSMLYGFQTEIQAVNADPVKKVLQMDLNTGDTKTLAQFACREGEDYFFVGTANGKLFFKRNVVDEQLLKQLQEERDDGMIASSDITKATVFHLFTIDPDSGEQTEIRNWSYGETADKITGNACFFFNNGSIDRLNPETGEISRIVEGQAECTPHNMEQVYFIAPYLIYNIHYPAADPDKALIKRFICNVDTLELRESTLTTTYQGINDPISIVTFTPQYLLVGYQIEEVLSSEKAGFNSAIKRRYAILDIGNFVDNQPEYIQIDEN